MNIKIAKMHSYQQLNLKSKLSKQGEQRQNHEYGKRFDGCQRVGECEGIGEEVRG